MENLNIDFLAMMDSFGPVFEWLVDIIFSNAVLDILLVFAVGFAAILLINRKIEGLG